MTNIDFRKKLSELSACQDAIDWVDNRDFKTAWDDCERADWMLWLMCKMEIATKRERIHIICDCAATSLKYVPKGDDRPRLAIEAARNYADSPTDENLRLLTAAGAEARAAAWAAGDAAGAARAAAWAAAWDAAWAAAWDAARAAARNEFNALIYECFGDWL